MLTILLPFANKKTAEEINKTRRQAADTSKSVTWDATNGDEVDATVSDTVLLKSEGTNFRISFSRKLKDCYFLSSAQF